MSKADMIRSSFVKTLNAQDRLERAISPSEERAAVILGLEASVEYLQAIMPEGDREARGRIETLVALAESLRDIENGVVHPAVKPKRR